MGSSDIYICDPSIPLTSFPSQSMRPSQSTSVSYRPSISVTPTISSIVIYLELHTHEYPEEMAWSLINESDDGIVMATGPISYDFRTLYSFSWTLNRCNSYKFQIFDSYSDGFDPPGYATLIVDGGRGNEAIGTIDGNFGSEESVDIYVCGE